MGKNYNRDESERGREERKDCTKVLTFFILFLLNNKASFSSAVTPSVGSVCYFSFLIHFFINLPASAGTTATSPAPASPHHTTFH